MRKLHPAQKLALTLPPLIVITALGFYAMFTRNQAMLDILFPPAVVLCAYGYWQSRKF